MLVINTNNGQVRELALRVLKAMGVEAVQTDLAFRPRGVVWTAETTVSAVMAALHPTGDAWQDAFDRRGLNGAMSDVAPEDLLRAGPEGQRVLGHSSQASKDSRARNSRRR